MNRIRLAEWSSYPAEGDPILQAALLFDSSSPESALRDQIERLAKSGMLTIEDYRSGLEIRSTSFVGKVAIGGLEIAIDPKIDSAPFLRLLRYAYGLRNLELIDRASFAVTELSFQDLLIYQLLLEATELIGRGLRREYIRHERDLAVPRGRIDVGRIAVQGGVGTATLPCVTHDRDENILLNQVLLAGIALAARSAESAWLRTKLNRVRSMIAPTIASPRLTTRLLSGARRELTRLTHVYEPAIDLIEMILEGQGISLGDEDRQVRLSGFLFDMNRFFQALLSRFLREHLTDCTLQDEQRIRGMMRYDPAHNPRGKQSPEPRPDFVITHAGKTIAILDAKYRDLWGRDLPRDMLYQLAIYALSQRENRMATILYPTIDLAAREAHVLIKDPLNESSAARVILRPVNLLRLDEVTREGSRGTAAEVERIVFAGQLAFGDS